MRCYKGVLCLSLRNLEILEAGSVRKHKSLKNTWGKMSFSSVMGQISVMQKQPHTFTHAGVKETKMLFKIAVVSSVQGCFCCKQQQARLLFGFSGDWSVYFKNQNLRSSHPDLEKPPPAQEGYNPYWSADCTGGSTHKLQGCKGGTLAANSSLSPLLRCWWEEGM